MITGRGAAALAACAVALPLLLTGCSTSPLAVVGLTLRDGRPVALVHACREQVTGAALLDGSPKGLAGITFAAADNYAWELPLDQLPAAGARLVPLYATEVVGQAMLVTPDDVARLREGVVRFPEGSEGPPASADNVEDDEDGFRTRACDAARDSYPAPAATPASSAP